MGFRHSRKSTHLAALSQVLVMRSHALLEIQVLAPKSFLMYTGVIPSVRIPNR